MSVKRLEPVGVLEPAPDEIEVLEPILEPEEFVKRTYIITADLEKNLKDLAQELAREGIKMSDSALMRYALKRGLPLVRQRLLEGSILD